MGKRRRSKPRPWVVLAGMRNEPAAAVASRWATKGQASFEAIRLRQEGYLDWVRVQYVRATQARAED